MTQLTLPVGAGTKGVVPGPSSATGPGTPRVPTQRDSDGAGAGFASDLLARAGRPDYFEWLAHVRHVGECTRPIQLAGRVDRVHAQTGEVVETTPTDTMPDGVLFTACGNRRASVCSACSAVYRADTYQLIKAGISGGKNVPETVAGHPFVFLTLTAGSFGLVHSTRTRNGRARKCRPRRNPVTCEHGVELACRQTHDQGDEQIGRPLCLDCYDHAGQVVFNLAAGELWRRTILALNKKLKPLGARVSFGKVAEMQARGVVHFHAILRLDGLTPDLRTNADGDVVEVPSAPPAGLTVQVLEQLLQLVVPAAAFTTPPHPDRPAGWRIAWGAQFDIRPVRADVRHEIGNGPITEIAVAAYLAKYSTKGTETTGHISKRLTAATVGLHTDPTTHAGRLVAACWHLGRPQPAALVDAHQSDDGQSGRRARVDYSRLRRWAHMLGFGGHFSTKSRRYSTTLGALRQARVEWRRAAAAGLRARALDDLHDEDGDTTLLVGSLTFAGTGWNTPADAVLARTAAAQARERRQTAKEELTTAHVAPTIPASTAA